MTESKISSSKLDAEFNIGEIVKARDRLWRIDQIHKVEKEIKEVKKKFIYYSVSNITGQPSSQVLIPDIETIKKSVVPKPSPEIIGSPIYQKLLLDAIKLDLIYGTTSFISLQNSKVIPISYQMVPVLMALNLKNVRLLLADDVGLGKTIEAGLILQELLGRKRINRVLFVTPANLREQWQAILKKFFGMDAVIMSRRNRRKLESELLVGGNPWGYYNFVITSIDYGKRPGVKEEIIQFDWDMIVIDEAHNVMRPHLGTDDEKSKSFKQSYGFAKLLANEDKFPHFLLLSATPHNGYKDSFASLLEMINPKIVSKDSSNNIQIDRDLAISHICQRRREDVQEWILESKYKKRIFPKRDSDEIYIKPSDKFCDTFELINQYFDFVLTRSKDDPLEKRKLNYWTILHFHKRAISSPNALKRSIENRLKEVDNILNQNFRAIEDTNSFLSIDEAAQSVMDGYETDRLTEEELDLRNDKLILTKRMADLKKEKDMLIEIKKSAIELMKSDRKIIELLDVILPERFKISKKIIIFTRYIHTLEYIKERLEEKIKESPMKYKDIEVFHIHGQMASQHRQDIYDNFLKVKQGILISTDCMAEGIDLQFSADQIINYELTWNPNRLEQRNGRIDRFGQPKEWVYIRTLILKDTLEMDILEVLVKKANEIKKAYGFVPGFFGDPESVIDHILAKRKKDQKQTTMDKWIKFSKVLDDLVSIFFSEKNVKTMMADSFYGHTNINLEEIEQRMRLTEENIGNDQTLLAFLKSAIDLYKGKIETSREDDRIYEITLPKEVQKDIGEVFGEKYLITPHMDVSASRNDVEGINLKNPLVSGLVEKVKNEAFSVDNEFYGRTAAFLSSETKMVSVIFYVKIRYVVHTEPKSLMEEIPPLGVDLFNRTRLDNALVDKIWNSEWENHGKNLVELKKNLNRALNIDNLESMFNDLAHERLKIIINERKEMINNLAKQGIATDLEGIEQIDVVGVDLLTITLIYPPVGGD